MSLEWRTKVTVFSGIVGSVRFPVVVKYLNPCCGHEGESAQHVKHCQAGSAQARACNGGCGTPEKEDAWTTENKMGMKSTFPSFILLISGNLEE